MPARPVDPGKRLTLIHSRQGQTAPRSGVTEADERASDLESTLGAAPPPSSVSWRQREDSELVILAKAGQSRAFEELYRRYSSYALALAVRVQGHSGDVEDIVHDSFLRVHDRLDHLRSGDSFRPWLASVVVSLVRSRMRRRRLLSLLGLSTSEPVDLDALTTPDAGPEMRAQLAQVYGTLQSVSVEQRICWTLRFVEGHKLEEVAQLADCSLATAKRRISAVQERLLQRDWAEERA